MNRTFASAITGLILAVVGSTASARCFNFDGQGPTQVGPVTLFSAAEKICYNSVRRMGGGIYHSISFEDREGALAQFASQTETLGRCPGFCRLYVLTSGNSNGQNVNPKSTNIEFQVESDTGKVTIGEDTYDLSIAR